MSGFRLSRRQALSGFAGLLAGSPCLRAQDAPHSRGEPPGRMTPVDEFANVPEFEDMARRSLNDRTFARIADGDRGILERITFRPRLLINALELDLSLDLLGQQMFAPILVGPASRQHEIHSDGERATARGASEASATVVTAERSGTPLADTTSLAPGSWRQVYPDADLGALVARVQKAGEAGCKATCLTLADDSSGQVHAGFGWDLIEQLAGEANTPLVLKGIMHPDDAITAIDRGVAGIIVSTHGAGQPTGATDPVAALPAIAEAVAGRIPVLVDGGIRRGSDVLKALALGATAALVCRPALWGLAAYGADGVRTVLEMLQTELARDMAQVGTVTLRDIRRDHIRVHRR